ncbi:uncharacterized protein JN550_000828 [Neoarthrinium moseri]|uniref:uncharacterized protein n=1 Tax=Neoarthrinium moseri TaxID=1658444 RepID=UPI001FDD92E0|nr:uncharacterized protein JN550_000828 [Neoarthrinium moseri]KAI1876756.1 hypothetical protein JN550_000828 [Neoarthrinium moseri]
MALINSDPISALQWALENLSPAEVQVRESFQKFLKRGTVSQLRQLLREAQELSTPPACPDAQHSFDFVALDPITTRAAVKNGGSTGFKGRRRASNRLCRPNTYPQAYPVTERLSELSIPVLAPSNTAAFSPDPSHSDSMFSPSSQGYGDIDALGSASPNSSPLLFPLSSCLPPMYSSPESVASSYDISELSSCGILRQAMGFFEARLGTRRNRVRYLVRAIQGFLEAPKLAPGFVLDIWSSRSAIFTKPLTAGCSNARLQNLYKGHRKLKQAREQYSYAARFCYIYLEHDLEELSKSQSLVLSQGRGKMTAAFELQASIISTSVDVVKAERKAGRGYLQLLMEGGPGYVLRLGCNVSTIWERKLSVKDISLIVEFLRTQTPELDREIKSHDKSATEALLDGFVAYGWSPTEILLSTSPLFEQLKHYVDLKDAFNQETREKVASNHSGATPENDHEVLSQSSDEYPAIPGIIDFETCGNDTSLVGIPLTPRESLAYTADCPGSDPKIINDVIEISETELASLLSAETRSFDHIDEMGSYQEVVDPLAWGGIFNELVSEFPGLYPTYRNSENNL